jgi:AcrR family transcriptional regulator
VPDQQTKTKKPVRRTTNERERGRAERVVTSVLQAAGEELARVGYAAFRVEDVAARSGVNKTSIYRRWPTKADLVKALLEPYRDPEDNIDTGSVRQDLRESLIRIVTMSNDPKNHGAMDVIASRADVELEQITHAIRTRHHEMRVVMIRRGIARGEIPATTDPNLIADMVEAPVIRRLMTFRQKVDERYVDAILDVVLAGLSTPAS